MDMDACRVYRLCVYILRTCVCHLAYVFQFTHTHARNDAEIESICNGGHTK